MNENDLFRLVALLALLAYLLPAMVRLPARVARGFRIAALALIGIGMAAALLLFVGR